MIILVANLKGGLRRTTIAMMLAIIAQRGGHTVAVANTTLGGDSKKWAKLAVDNGHFTPFD